MISAKSCSDPELGKLGGVLLLQPVGLDLGVALGANLAAGLAGQGTEGDARLGVLAVEAVLQRIEIGQSVLSPRGTTPPIP
jgi:hypothetical protein